MSPTVYESSALRPKAAAKYIGVSVPTLYRFAKDDAFFPKLVKLGVNTTVIMKADLDSWLRLKKEGAK